MRPEQPFWIKGVQMMVSLLQLFLSLRLQALLMKTPTYIHLVCITFWGKTCILTFETSGHILDPLSLWALEVFGVYFWQEKIWNGNCSNSINLCEWMCTFQNVLQCLLRHTVKWSFLLWPKYISIWSRSRQKHKKKNIWSSVFQTKTQREPKS